MLVSPKCFILDVFELICIFVSMSNHHYFERIYIQRRTSQQSETNQNSSKDNLNFLFNEFDTDLLWHLSDNNNMSTNVNLKSWKLTIPCSIKHTTLQRNEIISNKRAV